MFFSIPLNNTKKLSTLTTLLKQEAKVINRGGEKKKSPQQAMLFLCLMDHTTLQRAKESMSEWDAEMLLLQYVFDWLCFFS